MADFADLAGDIIDANLDRALSRSRLPNTVATSMECEDCGDEIPQARRHAAPWVTTCIECQGLREKRGRHHA